MKNSVVANRQTTALGTRASETPAQERERARSACDEAEQIFERAIALGIKALPKNQRPSAQWVLERKRENHKLHQERYDWDHYVEKELDDLGLDVILSVEHAGCRYECIAFDRNGKLVHVSAHFDAYNPVKIEPEEITCRASLEWAAKMEVITDFELDSSSYSDASAKWYRLCAAQLEGGAK